jgi:hypothetical protein
MKTIKTKNVTSQTAPGQQVPGQGIDTTVGNFADTNPTDSTVIMSLNQAIQTLSTVNPQLIQTPEEFVAAERAAETLEMTARQLRQSVESKM